MSQYREVWIRQCQSIRGSEHCVPVGLIKGYVLIVIILGIICNYDIDMQCLFAYKYSVSGVERHCCIGLLQNGHGGLWCCWGRLLRLRQEGW